MNTNQPFTERTAALTRLPQARILPKAALDLLTDMAVALDAHSHSLELHNQEIAHLHYFNEMHP